VAKQKCTKRDSNPQPLIGNQTLYPLGQRHSLIFFLVLKYKRHTTAVVIDNRVCMYHTSTVFCYNRVCMCHTSAVSYEPRWYVILSIAVVQPHLYLQYFLLRLNSSRLDNRACIPYATAIKCPFCTSVSSLFIFNVLTPIQVGHLTFLPHFQYNLY